MNCKDIQENLYYYIYDELSPEMEEEITAHLEDCDICFEYYEDLMEELKENKNLEIISAYIDNELDYKDSLKTKKNIISNLKVRKEFEKQTSLQSLLKNTFSRQETLLKEDYSKLIFRKLDLMEEVYGKNLFPEITGIFIVIFVGIFLTSVVIFGI